MLEIWYLDFSLAIIELKIVGIIGLTVQHRQQRIFNNKLPLLQNQILEYIKNQ
jgi:hypothetical protein